MGSCGGSLSEQSPGDLECSLGNRCGVAVALRTYYVTRDEAIAHEVRAAHPDWQPGWVQPG